ncbi:MAG: hypothetical protein Q7S87_01195 [Agitococcus sp.]|nr:hypothetical protein [Agitococcus sp.]MDO9179141.1 hypothetical protein [Agitococcus sp.]
MSEERSEDSLAVQLAIPAWMRNLPRDSRGFPVPFFTTLRAEGQAFDVAVPDKWERAFLQQVCGLCGKELGPLLAFVGGPLNLEHRYFRALPMHGECAEYALQVCPFIVYKHYESTRALEIVERQAMVASRPNKFLLGQTLSCTPLKTEDGVWWVKAGEWAATSWWRDGHRLSEAVLSLEEPVLLPDIIWTVEDTVTLPGANTLLEDPKS